MIGFHDHPRRNFLQEINWIGENNFDFVDVFLEEDEASAVNIKIYESKELLEKYNLNTVGYTAWYLLIGYPNKAMRQTAVKEISKCFDVFRNFGVKLVTVHADWASSMFSKDEAIDFQRVS